MLLPRKIYKVDLANILRTNFSISTPPLTSLFKEFSAFAVAKHIYGTLRNSSVVVSNLVGPIEPMVLANHPVKGLYFTMTGGPEYNKGIDSVVVVKKEDFDSCNINNPIQKMDGGDSTFQLSNSGLFYFISGNLNNCKNGEKLIVLVMAEATNS
ncbi:hypothetical protein JHK87_016747 [Glycine soja]|nr:hypothetical protein JHK87_016747 [Glycine soja]